MRKLFLVGILTFASYYGSAQNDGSKQLVHDYFRVDPFKGEFSYFLQQLFNDPALNEKSKEKKTDSTLFYFWGSYTNFNPFFFKPKRVEILLEETAMKYTDKRSADTMFNYQLIAYANEDAKGIKDIKKEFEKINRKYKNKFYETNFQEFKTGDSLTGVVRNYFDAYHIVAPISIIWTTLPEKKEVVLNVTIRLKAVSNRAELPAPLYNP